MDRLVTQFERGNNNPASKKWLLAKMRDFLMASKNIREEKISAIKALAEPAEDKARQDNVNRVINHGHNQNQNRATKMGMSCCQVLMKTYPTLTTHISMCGRNGTRSTKQRTKHQEMPPQSNLL